MRQEIVSGRLLKVVDTPGWMSQFPLDLTPKLTQLEIQESVYMCPPAPHAFVLVMPLDIKPYVGTEASAEEHVNVLLDDQVWKHAIVVFTVADKNKIKLDLIGSNYDFAYLTEKCEGRFHVLNISDRGDGSQVTKLMEKIDQIVTRRPNGFHCKTERQVLGDPKKMEITTRRGEERRADTRRTDLRILVLGQYWSGKSSAGNTILGGSVFKADHSSHCEVKRGEVAGRHLTVVDSPGWIYNSRLQDTSELDKLEIQNSVCLCPPGPLAVLLTVPLYSAFTKAQRETIEEHVTLVSQRLWNRTIVLFNYGDLLGDRCIEQHIEAEGEDLRWLVDKCGKRCHVFDNTKRDDPHQVTELLEKIEEMVAGNKEHFEVDDSEKLSEKMMNIEKRVVTKTHRQKAGLKALFEGQRQSLPHVRVMLVGGEHTGRNMAGNHILQKVVFRVTRLKEFKTQPKRTECVMEQNGERNVSVVNCPDWLTTPPSQKITDVLRRGLTLCSPGPHAVLLTVSVKSSFSEADRRSVEEHMLLMGHRVWEHTLVLFTWGWWLGNRHVEEYIESEGEPLRGLLEKCGYRYHVLDFRQNDIEITEVTELMEKIEDVVTRNRGHLVWTWTCSDV